MIQRIQSVWLFLAGAIIFALFMFPYLHFADASGLGFALKVTGSYGNVDGVPTRLQAFWFQSIGAVLVGLLPIFRVFLFGNRKKQIKFVYICMLAVVALGAWMYFVAQGKLSQTGLAFSAEYIGVGFFILPISIVFLAMGLGAIKKDEKLIKSADRIR